MKPSDPSITCPDSTALEHIAVLGTADESLSTHIEQCIRCRKEVERIRADNELIQEALYFAAGDTSSDTPDVASYSILGEIHRGGQGVVHRARHAPTQRTVALKTLLHGEYATSKQRQRFEREVELAARLRHPGIVSIYDSGVDSKGRCFIAMELVEGQTLGEVFPRDVEGEPPGPRPDVREVFTVFEKTADAVAFAHSRGVIHRDLKPSNVLIDGDGQPRVVDFGIAKMADEEPGPAGSVTVTGEFVGTLRYAAPEQLAAAPDLADVRADVYALGVMMYEAVTGRSPHLPSGSVAQMLQRVVSEEPTRPSEVRPDINKDAETILLKSLAMDPDRRYQSAAALRDDIRAWLEGRPIEARRDDAWYIARKWVSRHRVAVGFGTTAAVALVAFGVTMTALYVRAVRAERETRQTLTQSAAAIGMGDLETADNTRDRAALQLDSLSETARELLAQRPAEAFQVHTNLGLAFLGQERAPEALEEFQQALSVLSAAGSPENADLALAEHNIGRTLWKMGSYAQAEPHYRESLRIRLSLYGREHLDVAQSYQHLSSTLQNMGQFEEAATLIAEAIDIRSSLLGEGHPDIANAMTVYGGILEEMGRYADAAEQFESALRIATNAFGAGDWRVARVGHNLGVSLRRLGQYDRAQVVLARALATKRDVFGDQSLDTASTLIEVGRLCLEGYADIDGARAAGEEAMSIHDAVLEGAHPQQVQVYSLLGMADQASGEYAAALRWHLRAEELARSMYGDAHWRTATVLTAVGECRLALGDVGQATEVAAESVEALRSSAPLRVTELATALDVLADCYQAGGDTAGAATLREEADSYRGSSAVEGEAAA